MAKARTRNGSLSQPRVGGRRLAQGIGTLKGSRKDPQIIRSDWVREHTMIDGVRVLEPKNVPKGRGVLTEIFRRDWNLDDGVVEQVFQVWLGAGEVSAWHAHASTRDRLFVSAGHVKIVLYDARAGSKTFKGINQFQYGAFRPGLVSIPPGIWHGVQNLSHEPSLILNLVDHAYDYEDPDHWRLPQDTPQIPHRFLPVGQIGT